MGSRASSCLTSLFAPDTTATAIHTLGMAGMGTAIHMVGQHTAQATMGRTHTPAHTPPMVEPSMVAMEPTVMVAMAGTAPLLPPRPRTATVTHTQAMAAAMGMATLTIRQPAPRIAPFGLIGQVITNE